MTLFSGGETMMARAVLVKISVLDLMLLKWSILLFASLVTSATAKAPGDAL